MSNFTFTKDWFTPNTGYWKELLAPLVDRPARALEVGSYEGRSTVWLLQNILTHPDARIMCIDRLFQPPFIGNIQATGAAHKVSMTQAPSETALKAVGGTFDLIYIDGGHQPHEVMTDAVLAFPLTKAGTIVIFDDYRHGLIPCKLGVDPFMEAFKAFFDVVHCGYQFAIQRNFN